MTDAAVNELWDRYVAMCCDGEHHDHDVDVVCLCAQIRVESAIDDENSGYESDRELVIMRRFPGWPEAYR